MPFFNVGEDTRVIVDFGKYGKLNNEQVTSIDITTGMNVVEFQDLNGETNTRTVFSKGTTVTITMARVAPTLEKIVSAMRQDWEAGVPIDKGSATVITTEESASETTTMCQPVSWMFADLGKSTPGKATMQSFKGTAEGYTVTS